MSSIKLARDEQETVIYINAADRDRPTVYSDDPVMIKRLNKIATGTPHGAGMAYVLDKSQVSLRQRRAKRILSDEERAELTQRLRAGRELEVKPLNE